MNCCMCTTLCILFSSLLFSLPYHIVIDCRCILNLLSHIILFHITVKKTLSVEGIVGKVSDGYILVEMFADNIDNETMARLVDWLADSDDDRSIHYAIRPMM